ncbi:MAG TPA: hypothetical protein PKE29_15165 [Phycisphaerales bacterium]|nr:hypothetical protein [Phycisphaerales bacterium]
MSDLIYRLIGSPSLRLGQPGVEFGFAMDIPAWAWALIALGCVVFGVLAYRRTEGSLAGRVALGTLRSLLLLLLVVLLAGPRLIKPNETEEKDWVLVLTDRSASMSIADVPPPSGSAPGAKRTTRDQQLRTALAAAQPVFRALAAERVLVHLGFDASAYDLPVAPGSALPDLAEPAGRRTDLNRAIEQALRRGAARPISGIVLLTDGRTTDEPTRALLRRLETEKIPIFTVPLGSPVPSADLAVRRASAPRYAFVKDSVPVDIELQRTGPATSAGETSTVELIDAATGAILDTRSITWLPPTERPVNPADPVEQSQRIVLTTQPASAGPTKWTVRIRPSASGGSAADMVEDNNTAELGIDLVDRPLRIAYFDGYPRWEYRYLKNLLVREKSASAAVMLLAPGKRYIQEGTVILDALPHTPEEWNAFDVIMLGDVWPGVFTKEQLTQLKDRVSIGGAGLIWIGGEGSTPGAYRSTPLNELLPFSLPENLAASHQSGLDTFEGGVTITPTPAADRLGVLRLSDVPLTPTPTTTTWFPPMLSDPNTGWASLYWVQKIDPGILKPTAEVLALATPEGGSPATARPALLTMRYGAGRIVYVATDEIWRWRYGRGEMYPERFWIQLVRLLGRESVARSGRPAILEVTPDNALVEQPVRVQITLLDQSLADTAPPSLRVRVTRESAIDGSAKDAHAESRDPASIELTLTPEAVLDSTPGRAGASRVFAATWIPTDSGRYRAITDDPTLTSLATGAAADDLSARIDVWQADDELRRPQTDHALLARLADATGGKVLRPDQLADLPRLLPNRTLKLAGEPELHTLWDTPLALLLAVLLLSAEWIGRRLLRLA